MDVFLIVLMGAIFALAAGGVYLYYHRGQRRKVIDDIVADVNPLAVWTYSPEEWRRAVQDELSWGNADDGPVQVRISRLGIYFKGRAHEHLLSLLDGDRVVTFAAYGGAEGNPLKLRTRWRVISHDPDEFGREKIQYYKEDYRIPVPFREHAAATNVVNYFTKWLEDNPDFYTQMLPDDEPISLFGKDSF
jgi:hypothetical protein